MTAVGVGQRVEPSPLVLIGVASSAGTHHAGQERAPAALRAAGFVDRLRDAGLTVEDRGDIVTEVFRVDHDNPTTRDLARVIAVARAVADEVEAVFEAGALPVVIGGDCTITLGVVAGIQRRAPHLGVFYFDGDLDVSTPATSASGVLDSMGVGHLLGVTDTPLARLDGRTPMLTDDRLVLFGYGEDDAGRAGEAFLSAHLGATQFSDRRVRDDPTGCALAGLGALTNTSSHVLLHFDVDAVDSGDLPLANFPHYGAGVSLAAAADVLGVVAAAPELAGIVLTEVNPSYDPSGVSLRRYVGAVTGAIARRARGG